MKIYSFNEFVNEENAVQKARRKLLKATDKVDKFDNKSRAAQEEIQLRQGKVDYEKDKEKLKHQIDSASDEKTKGAAKDDLKKVKKDWKNEKKQLSDRIKALRKTNK
jgi:hypothetical protein